MVRGACPLGSAYRHATGLRWCVAASPRPPPFWWGWDCMSSPSSHISPKIFRTQFLFWPSSSPRLYNGLDVQDSHYPRRYLASSKEENITRVEVLAHVINIHRLLQHHS